MEGIVALVAQAVAGIAGGGVAGQVVKTAGMALLPKLLSGAVGGVAGGSLVGALLGGAADPGVAAAGGLDVGALIGQLAGGAVGGGALTAIVGQVLGKRG